MTILRICSLAILFLGIVSCSRGQVNYNQRDDQYRLLGLKRAKEAFEFARKEYERQKDLFTKNLISQYELDRSRNVFADAEVNYQQSLLAVLFEQQFVSVLRAMKFQGNNGVKHVRLTVANTSGGGAEFRKLIQIDDALFRSLQPDIINDVYLSLVNDQGAVIGQPYEAKIAQLHYGAPATIDFTLLQDVDAVTVTMIYGKGTTRTLKVFLQKDASVTTVAVQSQQFSQEAELGKTVSFDLTLELFGGQNSTFALEVVNLPAQINRYFKDAGSQARMTQLKFTESTNTRRATLEVSLPDRPGDEVQMDRAIPFYVLVLPRDPDSGERTTLPATLTQEEIGQLHAGYVRLELVPRGKGRLLVRAPQLYFSITEGGSAAMTLDLVNEGTRRLDNIEITVDQPVAWTKTIDPRVIASLGVSGEQQVHLAFSPPAGITPGRYEMRIRTSGLTDNEPVNGEDKTVTVEVVAQSSVIGTVVIILVILGLLGGIVVFGIRLSRR